jgi:uncharacterized protein YbcC (UPF0753/DUF2309 family)
MKNYSKEKILENRIIAVNALHDYLNKVLPKLNLYFQDNDVKIKTDGGIFKKFETELNKIIEDDKPVNLPNGIKLHCCYIVVNSYSNFYYVQFNVSISYSVSEFSCSYYDVNHTIMNCNNDKEKLFPLFKEYKKFDKDFIEKKRIQVSLINKKIDDLENSKSLIEKELGTFSK